MWKTGGERHYSWLACVSELPRKVVLGSALKGKRRFICGNLAWWLCPKKTVNRSLEVGGKVELE